jgi:hypothetical protein
MKEEKNFATNISVKSPCSENWNEMTGDEKTRACSHCQTNVNDISKMTEDEAWDLIDRSNGDLCIRYESHPVTNAPIFADRLYQITRQTGVTAGVLGATLAVSSTALGQESVKNNQLTNTKPTISSTQNSGNKDIQIKPPVVSPTPTKRPPRIMGKIAIRRFIRKPLMKAVNQGRTLRVRLMITQGVDVNEVDRGYYSRTALHVAVERNNLKMVKMLLNAGADLKIRDQYQNTPLMNINWSTTPEIIQIFSQYGADLNTRNRSGQTALMNAARVGNIKAVRALLESGADVSLRDNYGKSALEMTYTEPIKQLLVIYGAELSTDKT